MKNIILLMSDTFRYDNLFDRARRPIRTPMLDAFAKERATEVSHFITGSFPTIPHRTDLTSGRVGWPWYGWQAVQQSTKNAWPLMLRANGYATQLICDCPHLFNNGFQHLFQAAFQHRGQEGDCPILHLNDPITEVVPHDKTRLAGRFTRSLADQHRWTNRYYKLEEETFCYRTATTTTRWLEENYQADQPFLLWVDLFDPHEPWDPPEYLVKHYDNDYDGIPMIHPNYGSTSAYTDAELHNLWAHYAAEAELVDRALGRMLQKIDDLQLWDDSIVVVTSDHGFSIGEHGRAGKSNIGAGSNEVWPLYPEINRVPFLIAAPEVAEGGLCDIIAQPVDIMPTISELAGVPVEMPEPVQGKSFASALCGKSKGHRDFAVTASKLDWSGDRVPDRAGSPFVTTQKWGYTPVGPRNEKELYDLDADPLAETNIAAQHPNQVKKMEEMFMQHLAELGAESAIDFWRKVIV